MTSVINFASNVNMDPKNSMLLAEFLESNDSPFISTQKLDVLNSGVLSEEVNVSIDVDGVRILSGPCAFNVISGNLPINLYTQPWITANANNMWKPLMRPGYYGMQSLEGGSAMPFLQYGNYNVYLYWPKNNSRTTDDTSSTTEIRKLSSDLMEEFCCLMLPAWLSDIPEPERTRMLENQETICTKRSKRISCSSWPLLANSFPTI
jgi:hypothetical protein